MAKFLGSEGLTELVAQIKAYVTGQISSIDGTIFKVVTELPTSDIDETKIYVVPAGTTADNNLYVEYIYANGAWEKLGEVAGEVDLSDYVKSETLADYATTESLSEYAKSSDLDEYAKESELADYAKASDIPSLDGYVTEDALSDYAKTEDIPDVEEISTEEIDALFE